MKTLFGITALSAALVLSAPALAGHGYYEGEYAWARVVEVTPVVERVDTPRYRQECYVEPVRERVVYGHPHHGGHSAPILGGIIGGLIGNQIGHGGGRAAATVAGVALGSAVASDYHYSRHGGGYYEGYRTVEVERCREVADYGGYEEQVVGYDVAYRYGGRIYHTRTDEDPGERIRIRVDVRPAY